jgi:hypothetical protein
VAGDLTVVDVCQGIDLAAWQEAGWRVSSLTGVPASLPGDRSSELHTCSTLTKNRTLGQSEERVR